MTYYGVAYDDGTFSGAMWCERRTAEAFIEVREGGALIKSGVVFEVEVRWSGSRSSPSLARKDEHETRTSSWVGHR